jgi:hypothetical protein
MGRPGLADDSKGRADGKSRESLAWLILTWGRVIVGLALAGEGASLYAHARTHVDGPAWCIGAGAALIGALLSFSGVHAIRTRGASQAALPEGMSASSEVVMPKLGALLVYKYQVITEGQLEQALQRQREDPEKWRRLGEVLLDMGFISVVDLQEALDYQRSQRPASQKAGAGMPNTSAPQVP